METTIKTTPLTTIHEKLGAKILPFAGYMMPISYESINVEHETVRKSVGIFDVSHMGEFLLSGANALNLIQKITTNDASTLAIGQAQYSCMPNESGGIVDDLLVYRIKEEQYMLVVNASNIQKDWDWIKKYNDTGVEMKNVSDDYSLLAIQGPKTIEAIQKLTSIDLSKIEYYHFIVGDFAGFEHTIISATGYTGAGGFEIYCKNDQVEKIWNAVLEAGKQQGIKPVGLAARDTLRLEMGFRLYGNDINDSTSPIEAGLGWITKFNKSFINCEHIKLQKEQGVSKKLIGFEMIEKGIPRHDYEIVDKNGTIIGNVTSGTMSPSMSKGIGMGYVTTERSTLNTEIYIRIRKNDVLAKVVKMPFFENKL